MNLPPLDILLSQIDALMATIKSMRPLSDGELMALRESMRVLEVYNSNAIEGNTLTLGETRLIIEDGLTVGGKPLREIHEAENLAKAIDIFVQSGDIISEEMINSIHRVILSRIDDENAGIYRRIQVSITGEESLPPPAKEVPYLMKQLVETIHAHDTLHPVLLAAGWHYDFVKIHPFIDGNGRTARLISNIMLIQRGFPMIILPLIRRHDYIQSLHSKTGNKEIFQQFYADIVHENLKDYLRMIQP